MRALYLSLTWFFVLSLSGSISHGLAEAILVAAVSGVVDFQGIKNDQPLRIERWSQRQGLLKRWYYCATAGLSDNDFASISCPHDCLRDHSSVRKIRDGPNYGSFIFSSQALR